MSGRTRETQLQTELSHSPSALAPPPVLQSLLNERTVLAGSALRLQQKIAELQDQLESVHG